MAQSIVRSRYCGLKDIYIAKVTENTATAYTTETPSKLARSLSAKISDKFTREKLYSDDGVEDIIDSYEGTDVEIIINAIAAEDYAKIYNNIYEKGFLIKSGSHEAVKLALGYRTKRKNGKYDFVWFYCGEFERPEKTHETQAEKIATQTITIKGSFYEREKEVEFDGKKFKPYSIEVDESNLLETETEAKNAIVDWFSKVQEYPEVTP